MNYFVPLFNFRQLSTLPITYSFSMLQYQIFSFMLLVSKF